MYNNSGEIQPDFEKGEVKIENFGILQYIYMTLNSKHMTLNFLIDLLNPKIENSNNNQQLNAEKLNVDEAISKTSKFAIRLYNFQS